MSRWIFPCLLLLAPLLRAQEADAPVAPADILDQVVVYGREEDLVGSASSPSEGDIGSAELDARPFLRRGELLESIPGMIVTQHSGDGKANQYFLRGFNLDHGTDFATTVDGMPVNLPSNAHGQGYSDLNFIIPEFIQSISYEKGVYDAGNGDFSAAGAAQVRLVDALPRGFAKLEAGGFGYSRLVAGDTLGSPGGGATTAGFEAGYYDGPWTNPEDASHFSGYLRRTGGTGDDKWALTLLGYHASWNSTDQVPLRAIDGGLISRFGAIDPSDGGATNRASLSFDWRQTEADGDLRVNVYAIYYRLNLFSDFTYFLVDPVHGDQFNQRDRRGVFGGSAARDYTARLAGRSITTTLGVQARSDTIALGLLHTEDRVALNPVELDSVHEDGAGLYVRSEWHLAEWLRVQAALRADGVDSDVDANLPANSGRRSAALLSPKFGAALGPWDRTELYVDAGDGFHSNDARGTVERVDPADGLPVEPVTPLARAEGAEMGVRTAVAPGLVSTVSVWILDLDSELTFDGDTGETVPSGATRRYGVEFANFYRISPWLALDGDLSFTHARYLEETNGGFQIANSIGTVATSGITAGARRGWFGSLRLRYFGPQPIIEDGSEWEPSSLLFNLRLGWRNARWEASVDILNLFDRTADDIAYYYVSRLPGEPAAGVPDFHIHPAEPREARFAFGLHF